MNFFVYSNLLSSYPSVSSICITDCPSHMGHLIKSLPIYPEPSHGSLPQWPALSKAFISAWLPDARVLNWSQLLALPEETVLQIILFQTLHYTDEETEVYFYSLWVDEQNLDGNQVLTLNFLFLGIKQGIFPVALESLNPFSCQKCKEAISESYWGIKCKNYTIPF